MLVVEYFKDGDRRALLEWMAYWSDVLASSIPPTADTAGGIRTSQRAFDDAGDSLSALLSGSAFDHRGSTKAVTPYPNAAA